MLINYLAPRLLFVIFCLVQASVFSQVGINTDTPSPGALLDIDSPDKGFLMTRVELTETTNPLPITPSPTTGLLVYNTVDSPAGTAADITVTPGFYYWSGLSWRRFFNQGFTLLYTQSKEVFADGVNNPETLPGLDTMPGFTVPFSGTYQIMVNAYYAAGDNTSNTTDGATQGAINLQMATNGGSFTKLKENYFTSSSKKIDGNDINGLAQNVTILVNVDLSTLDSYQFKVVGEEWRLRAVESGYFGRDTIGDSMNPNYENATDNDAQRGSMIITLIRQF